MRKKCKEMNKIQTQKDIIKTKTKNCKAISESLKHTGIAAKLIIHLKLQGGRGNLTVDYTGT